MLRPLWVLTAAWEVRGKMKMRKVYGMALLLLLATVFYPLGTWAQEFFGIDDIFSYDLELLSRARAACT